MKTLISELVIQELIKNHEVTLNTLYEILSKDPRVRMEPKILKHRIRAKLYSLENNGKVVKVGRATFSWG